MTVPPIISGLGIATNFKFRRYIQSVHANKSLLKNWENREHGRIQGLPKFLEYPLLSQEWVKLRTSNLTDIFRRSIRTKALYKFGRIRSVGESRDSPNFWSTPYYLRNG